MFSRGRICQFLVMSSFWLLLSGAMFPIPRGVEFESLLACVQIVEVLLIFVVFWLFTFDVAKATRVLLYVCLYSSFCWNFLTVAGVNEKIVLYNVRTSNSAAGCYALAIIVSQTIDLSAV